MGRVDSHVGNRIRARRAEIGKSQQRLAEEVGLTFQQIQKYELGQNRVAAPKLWAISNALGVRVDYFFEGLDARKQHDEDNRPNSRDAHAVNGPQALRLVRYFHRLDQSQKNAILGLIISMSTEDDTAVTDIGPD
ncbi:MAG: helix-turn-helix transcriptional regulator [Maritimibacter sp.]|nr:helix-turn-helix transcriptional regulator [Maritimibacter sp.]